jgi:hypothetical protein
LWPDHSPFGNQKQLWRDPEQRGKPLIHVIPLQKAPSEAAPFEMREAL